MSKIIKAAELKVLVTSDTDTVIPTLTPIKNNTSVSTGGTILDGSNLIKDAKKQAEVIVLQADEEARRILNGAEEELETLRLKTKEEGYAAGYEEGVLDGREKALQEAKSLLDSLNDIVQEGIRIRESNLTAMEDDFLKLSLLLADKIVRKTIKDDISWLEPITKEALRQLGTVEEVVIYLSPMDYSLVKEHEDELLVGVRAKISFERDPALSQGGCLIESENGLIDARLERRLGKLGHHLMEVLYHENH